MPTISAPAKVLVSGANGYIAIWVVRTLLEKGYSVRGTVRSADKGQHLKETFSHYDTGKLELVVVEDITMVCLKWLLSRHIDVDIYTMVQEGAFDEAVKGVDAILHTASPFHLDAEDPNGSPIVSN